MKKTLIKNLLGRVSVIILIIMLGIFICSAIKFGIRCISEKKILQYLKTPDKTISENIFFNKKIIEIANFSEDLLTEDDFDNIYKSDGSLLYIPEIADDSKIEEIAKSIIKFSQKTDTQVYFTVIPSASSVYYEEFTLTDLPLQEKKSTEYFYSELGQNIRYISLYNTMRSSKSDYIYYRTDKQWTSYGSFCGYRKIIQKLGYTPTSFSDYTVSGISSDFYGNLYDDSKVTDIDSDCIEKYNSINGSKILYINGEKCTDENSIYFDKYLDNNEDTLKYYMGDLGSITTLETNVRNDKNLLIFKDDYANEMIEFLSQHYKQITIVDMESVNEDEYKRLIEAGFDDYSEILFLCGYETLTGNDFFEMMNGR